MDIRSATPKDVMEFRGIDAIIESFHYIHLDRTGEHLNINWKMDIRQLREKLIQPNPISDDLLFTFKQVVAGVEEGMVSVAEHDGQIIGSVLSVPRAESHTLHLLDIRIDYEYRRQGLASVLLYRLIEHARQQEVRAIFAETLTNNQPAAQMLQKIGFELSGLDIRRRSNHDLVKESATLLWYLELT